MRNILKYLTAKWVILWLKHIKLHLSTTILSILSLPLLFSLFHIWPSPLGHRPPAATAIHISPDKWAIIRVLLVPRVTRTILTNALLEVWHGNSWKRQCVPKTSIHHKKFITITTEREFWQMDSWQITCDLISFRS